MNLIELLPVALVTWLLCAVIIFVIDYFQGETVQTALVDGLVMGVGIAAVTGAFLAVGYYIGILSIGAHAA